MKIIITNLPAFYKIRLYNEVNKTTPLLVLFTNKGAEGRNNDFYEGQIEFKYNILNGGFFSRLYYLCKLLYDSEYSELIMGGWDNIEQFIGALISPKRKNSLFVESTVYESTTKGIKSYIKKLFLRRISKVYAAGSLHSLLIKKLGFDKRVIISGGCGLLNYQPQQVYKPREKVRNFLFVGRLIEVKQLDMLIDVFNTLPNLHLSIIGFGEKEDELKQRAKDNTSFLGAIPNKDLSNYYKDTDVFVLPSKSETWGLVVEEALNNGTPVIVSDRVGCHADLITERTGIVFDYSNPESLRNAVIKMTDINFYNMLRIGVASLNFLERANKQIDCFV